MSSKVCPRQQWQIDCSAKGIELEASNGKSYAAIPKDVPRKSKKKKTDAEIAHHTKIAAMPCLICEALGMVQVGRTHVHHIRDGAGMSERSSHYLVLPLCHEHHQGKTGIHGNRMAFKLAKLTELDLLALIIERTFH